MAPPERGAGAAGGGGGGGGAGGEAGGGSRGGGGGGRGSVADLSQDMSYMCALTRPVVQGEEGGDPSLAQSVTPPSPSPFCSRELEEDVLLKHQAEEGVGEGVGKGEGEGGGGSEGSGGECSEESEEEIEEVLSLLGLLVQTYTY